MGNFCVQEQIFWPPGPYIDFVVVVVGLGDLLGCVTTESNSCEIFNPVDIKSLAIIYRQIFTLYRLTIAVLQSYKSYYSLISYKAFHSLTSLFHKKVLRARSALAILSSKISFSFKEWFDVSCQFLPGGLRLNFILVLFLGKHEMLSSWRLILMILSHWYMQVFSQYKCIW